MTSTLRHARRNGFTLIEILVALAIIGILGLVAVVGYQQYISRARAADIVVKYDAIRSGIGSQVSGDPTGDCNAQAKRFSDANLADDYARLAYDFQPTPGGFRPVLTVCAKADQGQFGVKVARGAHETLSQTGSVEAGAVVSDTAVSFALPLTSGSRATCSTYTPAPSQGACDIQPARQAQAPAQAAATQSASTSATASSPVGSSTTSSSAAQAAASAGSPKTCRVVVDGLQAALPSGSQPWQWDPQTQASLPPPTAITARGSECLLCGDLQKGTPCTDLDLVLAMTARCPETQSICMTDMSVNSAGAVSTFGRCVDARVAHALPLRNTANAYFTTPSGDTAVLPVPGTELHIPCYGDGCNIPDATTSVTPVPNARLVCD